MGSLHYIRRYVTSENVILTHILSAEDLTLTAVALLSTNKIRAPRAATKAKEVWS